MTGLAARRATRPAPTTVTGLRGLIRMTSYPLDRKSIIKHAPQRSGVYLLYKLISETAGLAGCGKVLSMEGDQ